MTPSPDAARPPASSESARRPNSEAGFRDAMRALYAEPGILPASVREETGDFLHALVKMTRPKLCVELGAFRGISTLWIARALEEIGEGVVHGFDVFESSDMAEVERRLREFRLDSRARVHRAASSTTAVEIMRDLGEPIDLLYVDAEHRVLATAADLQSFWPLVRMGGTIVLHDVFPEFCGSEGPRYALDRLRSSGLPPQNVTMIELPTPEGYGLALLQKHTEPPPKILPSLAYLAYQWRTRRKFSSRK